jgi:hypothetical protein
MRLIDYLRWAELHIYMTVHELSLTCTRLSGQGPNRYIIASLQRKVLPLIRSVCSRIAGKVSDTVHRKSGRSSLAPPFG